LLDLEAKTFLEQNCLKIRNRNKRPDGDQSLPASAAMERGRQSSAQAKGRLEGAGREREFFFESEGP
jgi:hypothetical protein